LTIRIPDATNTDFGAVACRWNVSGTSLDNVCCLGTLVVAWTLAIFTPMTRRKQVYKITYPNGKIYVGMDLTGTLLYMGSPSAHEQIAADLELEPHRFELTLRKEILWESETATDAEVRAKEIELIRATGANNPELGYNVVPRWLG
jgi:hypothetical protein